MRILSLIATGIRVADMAPFAIRLPFCLLQDVAVNCRYVRTTFSFSSRQIRLRQLYGRKTFRLEPFLLYQSSNFQIYTHNFFTFRKPSCLSGNCSKISSLEKSLGSSLSSRHTLFACQRRALTDCQAAFNIPLPICFTWSNTFHVGKQFFFNLRKFQFAQDLQGFPHL